MSNEPQPDSPGVPLFLVPCSTSFHIDVFFVVFNLCHLLLAAFFRARLLQAQHLSRRHGTSHSQPPSPSFLRELRATAQPNSSNLYVPNSPLWAFLMLLIFAAPTEQGRNGMSTKSKPKKKGGKKGRSGSEIYAFRG